MAHRAVFLDRDGVLIEDRDFLASVDQLRIIDGVPLALRRLKEAGFRLVVITNQAVVARGLITEAELRVIHATLTDMLQQAGAPPLDAIYYCPHHPEATMPEYRVVCNCRKPRPGSILRAAQEHDLAPAASFLVGDRITDIMAGTQAGCRNLLVRSPQHLAAPIATVEPLDMSCRPDHVCADLLAAAAWILSP